MANTLVKAEIFTAGVMSKLGKNRKLAQFVEQESVVGQQAGIVNVVVNQYIGDAEVVAPGALIPLEDMKQNSTPVEFEKLGKGVALTDEEKAQTFGDPAGNAETQTVMAIDGKAEAKIAALMDTATFSVETKAINAEALLDAIATMGEGIEDAPYFLVLTPKAYGVLQKEIGLDFDLNNNPFGAEIVLSTRIADDTAFLVQEGAIKEIVQKTVDVEVSRNASRKRDEIYTDLIHAVYVQDQSKLVKIKVVA